jgi:hypothetical protein
METFSDDGGVVVYADAPACTLDAAAPAAAPTAMSAPSKAFVLPLKETPPVLAAPVHRDNASDST